MTLFYLVVLVYAAVGSTAFVVTYHVLARWWESAVGRNVMLLMGSLAAVFDLWLLNRLLDRPEWMLWVFGVLLAIIGSAVWWRLYLLVKAQRRTGTIHPQEAPHG